MSDLATVVEDLGVEVKRQSGDELQGRCPVHHLYKGRPSDRYSWYINVDTGLWHCFTCGARGNLPLLVSALTKDPHAIMEVHKFLVKAGLERRNAGPPEAPEVVADWKAYASFDKVPERLLKGRGLDPLQAARFGIRFNKHLDKIAGTDVKRPDYKCWIVPVMDPYGNLMGWQAKSKGYFANIPEGIHKSESLFGYNFARSSSALLVESPLDVVRFHSVYEGDDISAVASYGASVSDFQIGLLKGKFDRLIIGLDNDPAGILETSRLRGRTPKQKRDLLSGFRKRVWYLPYGGTTAKDIGDMTDTEIVQAVSSVSRVPS